MPASFGREGDGNTRDGDRIRCRAWLARCRNNLRSAPYVERQANNMCRSSLATASSVE